MTRNEIRVEREDWAGTTLARDPLNLLTGFGLESMMTYRDVDELRAQIRPGMPVVGEYGDKIGTVKAALEDNLRVDRTLKLDVLVPYGNVESVNETGVMLNVLGGDADVMVDPAAPLAGSPHAPSPVRQRR